MKLPDEDISPLQRIRQFLIVFLPFTAILLIGAAAHFYTLEQRARVTRESHELLNVGLARSALNRDLANVLTDLQFLAGYLEQQGADGDDRQWRAHMGRLFLTFAREKRLYDQIRFLDILGRERVRVNYLAGRPEQVPVSGLQDKSSRYYFRNTMRLHRGEVYISPLDLNVERGAIERPFKPVMRFAIPIYDRTGGKKGILVLNYLGERMLHNFTQAGANIADHLYLVNPRSYWLSSPRQTDAWGFMLPHGRRFADVYPLAWRRIQQVNAGQLHTPKGLFTFETVTPARVAAQVMQQPASRFGATQGGEYWKVVALVGNRGVAISARDFLRENLPLYLVTLLVLLVGSGLLTEARIRHHRAELRSAYERRFRNTLEDIQLAAITLDGAGRLVFCNDFFLRLGGWRREQLLQRDWIEQCVAPEQRAPLRESLHHLQQTGELPREMETELLTEVGERRLIAWHNTPALGGGGEVVAFTSLGEDITERMIAEEEVRRLHRAVEQSPSIVLLTDRHGNIEYVNPKFTEVTGYTPAEVLGRNPRILKSGETSGAVYRELWRTVMAGGEWRGEFHNRRKNGELYWESASISGLRGGDGEISEIIAVKEDITERKRLEAEVAARNRELAHNQALAVMGRMASMIAHDLRNPLSSIKMSVQILARQATEEARELAQIALDQIRYMEDILTDMLAYARPEAVETDWVELPRLLDATLVGLQRRLDETGIQVTVDYQAGLPTLPADANKLRQLFTNLLTNALQALQAKPAGERRLAIGAHLQLGASGTAILVEICDNGPGLGEQDPEQLFEPFFTTRAKGTGLGLAIVRQIAIQHGGEVELRGRESGGICVRVTLSTTPRHAGQGPSAGKRRSGGTELV